MFDQIARRKEREERQESSLERYFSVFFVVLIKRAFCAAALAVALAGIVVWGNKAGIAKEEGEIINSYNAPEENNKDVYELMTAKEEIKVLAYEGCQQVEAGSFEHELSLWKTGYGAEKPEIWKCEAIIYYDEKDGVFRVG